ncbi:MAG: Ku protein [Longimicrobiales bacterium]
MPERRKHHKRRADGEQDGRGNRARAFWTGTLTFGLVSVPVELYSANRPQRVRLHWFDQDGTPLRRRYVCPEEGEEVGFDEIVRGYEIKKDRYVALTDEELEALEPEKSRDIDLRRFVNQDELDPMFFERAYFLAPGRGSTKAYRLLAETMERIGRAGIATFVMRTKEYLVAILAENGILRAETLRFAGEIRSPDDVGLPERPKRIARKAEQQMVKAIADAAADDFDESELEDRYAERVLELVEKKRRKKEDVVHSDGPAARDGEDDEEGVIDLMALLKRRMQEKGGSAPARKSAKRAPAKDDDDDDLAARSKGELYERAKALDIGGRSEMTKDELIRAIRQSA